MNTVAILKAVCGAPGVSGAEQSTAAAIETILRNYTDDVRTDRMGNLIVVNTQPEMAAQLPDKNAARRRN